MALGLGEGGEQSAPLGRAVIGGLVGVDDRDARRPAGHVRRSASAKARGARRRSIPTIPSLRHEGPRHEDGAARDRARARRLRALAGGAPAAAAAPEPRPPTVEVGPGRRASKLDTTAQLPGELAPYEMVALYPRVSGFVEEIAVDRGSVVKRGQLLARLSAPELAAQRAEAESKLVGGALDLRAPARGVRHARRRRQARPRDRRGRGQGRRGARAVAEDARELPLRTRAVRRRRSPSATCIPARSSVRRPAPTRRRCCASNRSDTCA